MHSALQTPEILSIIVDYATSRGPDWHPQRRLDLPERQRRAYTLARTCRAFLPLARESLWRTINCFIPLMYTLPRNLWRINSVEEWREHSRDLVTVEHYALCRDLREADLERFDFYVAYIRVLSLCEPESIFRKRMSRTEEKLFPASVIKQVIKFRPYVLPNLAHLQLYINAPKIYDHAMLRSLLPCSLKSLCLDASKAVAEDGGDHSDFEIIADHCPNISSLWLNCSTDRTKVGWITSFGIQKLLKAPGLQFLSTSWDPEAGPWGCLCSTLMSIRTSTITSLELVMSGKTDDQLNVFQGSDFFPNLQFFKMHAACLRQTIDLITAMGPRMLKELYINHANLDTMTEFFNLAMVLRDTLDHNWLTHLHIKAMNSYHGDPISPLKKPTEIIPSLLVFRNLRSLVLRLHVDFQCLTDHDLLEMSSSLPQLAVLDIEGSEDSTNVTTDAIFSAMAMLPRLQFFGMRSRFDPPKFTTSMPSFPQIHTLAPRGCPVTESTATAKMILAVFPSLKWVIAGNDYEMVGHDAWIAIGKYMWDAESKYPMVKFLNDANYDSPDSLDWFS